MESFLSRSESRINENFQSSQNTEVSFQLEDLLAFYPPSDTPNIQTIVTSKKEFNELKASTTEPVPSKGEYFKHQKLVQRLMRAVDKLLILHEAGTGKTCTMISVSEFYEMMSRTLMGMRNSLLRQGFPIKKTYVLIRNDILKDEFLNQLVCTCTVNKYDTPYVKEARDERSRMFRIKKEIERFYEVINYRDFSNRISKLVKVDYQRGKPVYEVRSILTDDQIKKEFSNCLFFADEIHNLRNVEGDFGEMKDEDQESSIVNYASLWKVFHTANNIKIMLATATPMINAPSDLVPTLNLLLPVDKQVKDGTDFARWSLSEFEKLVRGMVSFVRVLDTGIDVVYKGRPVEGSTLLVAGEEVDATTIVEPSEMSEFQSRAYLDAEVKETRGGKSGGIRKAARHASNFVFPKEIKMVNGRPTFDENQLGLYGREGFEKYVNLVKDKYYQFNPDFSKLMENKDNFKTFSKKFYKITKQIDKEEGNCFCFTDDFAVASGAILLGLCFEKKYGFSRYDPKGPVFKIVGCTKDQEENEEREIAVKKAKRYAILTSDTDKETIRKILSLFNNKENMNGEYIKVILASRKAREGLNLANVQNIHLVNPAWNQSNMYQAIYRAIRATSHVELIKAKKEEAIQRGEDPNKVRVKVKIYQHCSILNQSDEIQEYSIEVDKENFSVELQMYQYAEQKDRNNAVVMRMLKQCAIDCQINMERNKGREGIDQNGSQTCNYMECNYECVDPAPLGLDFTTYDVYYKDELVQEIKEKLLVLFEIKNQYSISEILKNITDFPPKFVIQGLSEMIKEKTPFLNRYGYTSFLAENGDLFFLMNELNAYSTENIETIYTEDVKSIGKVEYNENLYGVGRRDFDETTRMLRKPLDEKKVSGLLQSENLLKEVETMDNKVLITLIENLLLKKRSGALDPMEESVLKKYKNLIYEIGEPLNLLEDARSSLSAPLVPKKGRKKILDAPVKITKLKKEINLDEIEYGEPVVFHLLDLLSVDKAGYKTTTKYLKCDANIRILKSSEGQWRDVTDIEKLAYNGICQAKTAETQEKMFEDKDIFGRMLQDNIFRIIDKAKESEKAKTNSHHELKGADCKNSLNFPELADIMYRLKLKPENFGLEMEEFPKDKNGIIKYLKKKDFKNIDDMPMDQLIEAAKWVATGYIKVQLCEIIKEFFEQQKLLFKLVE